MSYDVLVPGLAQRVCRYIRERELLRAGDRVGAAVSGGADSVALLRLLLELRPELGLVLSLVHVNHGIRGAEADSDLQFVAELARVHGLPLHAFSADTPAYAAAHQFSLEAAAREIRYQYFQQLLADGQLDKVATAHTLDDQAETVLLRLARGSGITGLAGIYPNWPYVQTPAPGNARVGTGLRPVQGERSSPASTVQTPAPGCLEEKYVETPAPGNAGVGTGLRPVQGERSSPASPAIIRPLLSVRRSELQSYLQTLAQPWREDATNLDLRFARNRVRHHLLPALERELNPRISELLAETADIARAEENYWAAEVARILPQLWATPGEALQSGLRISELGRLPLALQRRLLRAAAESLGLRLDFHHVEEALALATAPPAGEKKVVLPDGWRLLRRRDVLDFQPPVAAAPSKIGDFEYLLPLPGEIEVAETGTVFRATVGPLSPQHATHTYDPARLPGPLRVRNWRPGDRFWPAHTRAPKKVKELLQERKIPLAQRRAWPVIASSAPDQEEIIWMRGFLPPQRFLAASGQHQGLTIAEFALQEAPHRAE